MNVHHPDFHRQPSRRPRADSFVSHASGFDESVLIEHIEETGDLALTIFDMDADPLLDGAQTAYATLPREDVEEIWAWLGRKLGKTA